MPIPEGKLAMKARKIEASQEEKCFLEGPRSRWEEFKFTVQVMNEFIKGFRAFHFAGPCATVFGSARFPENNDYYKMAREVGKGLSEIGFTVMTGGGPGIMEAANRAEKKMPAEGLSVQTSFYRLNRTRILISTGMSTSIISLSEKFCL